MANSFVQRPQGWHGEPVSEDQRWAQRSSSSLEPLPRAAPPAFTAELEQVVSMRLENERLKMEMEQKVKEMEHAMQIEKMKNEAENMKYMMEAERLKMEAEKAREEKLREAERLKMMADDRVRELEAKLREAEQAREHERQLEQAMLQQQLQQAKVAAERDALFKELSAYHTLGGSSVIGASVSASALSPLRHGPPSPSFSPSSPVSPPRVSRSLRDEASWADEEDADAEAEAEAAEERRRRRREERRRRREQEEREAEAEAERARKLRQ